MCIERDRTRAVPLASMYQRASTLRPLAVVQPLTRSPAAVCTFPDEFGAECPGAIENPRVERRAVDVQRHGFEAERRAPDRRWRGRCPRCLAELVDDDVLFVGGDVARDQRVHFDPETPEQAWAGPVEGFADLAVWVRLSVQADDAQPGVPQQNAGGKPGDACSNDRDVIGWSGVHSAAYPLVETASTCL